MHAHAHAHTYTITITASVMAGKEKGVQRRESTVANAAGVATERNLLAKKGE